MTIRAVVLGLLLGMLIAALSYFNDHVVRQSYLIGNHLPAAVFGLWLLLLLVVNPLWRAVRGTVGGATGAFRGGEMAIILAMGLAVCGWPGSNLMRYFSSALAQPALLYPTQTAWQAQGVMSYLPGGSPLLAEGMIADYDALVARLQRGLAGEETPAVNRVALQLQPAERRLVTSLEPGRPMNSLQRRDLVTALNRLLEDPRLFDGALPEEAPNDARAQLEIARATHDRYAVASVNRVLLQWAMEGIVRPVPRGEGVLLNNGRRHPVASDGLRSGLEGGGWRGPTVVPWGVWWPSLRLWIGTALLLGLASLCMVVVVHPQWSQRELLPYPTVRFVEEITEAAPGRLLPAITLEKLFWMGLIIALGLHSINGLNAWFNELPAIQRQFNLNPLRPLFPNAAQASGAWAMWTPTIYLTVIGFGFFIPTKVALSLGLSLVFWVALSAWLLTWGIRLEAGHFNLGANGTAMRFGAYLAMTLFILYFGRRYYLQILRATVGLGVAGRLDAPRASVWAMRGLVVTSALASWMLVHYAGLTWLTAVLLVLMLLMIFLVLTRINVETGLFYAQPDFMPAMLLGAIFGASGIGPDVLLALTIASVILVADPREAVAPYLANGLRMTERVGGVSVGRAAGPLGLSMVLGLIVAVVATLTVQYNVGLNPFDTWSNRNLAADPYHTISRQLAEMSSLGEVSGATGLSSLDHLLRIDPMPGTLTWISVGAALVFLCAFARLRLPWWPLHPVIFLVWGTYPSYMFAASFLLAAAVKGAVTNLGGVRAYQKTKPLMVGLIAGEVIAVVIWAAVGQIFYAIMRQQPDVYRIFPT